MSPTPNWSSVTRKIPDRKSLTSVWAPNPSATPTTPALASSGLMFRPISVSTASSATLNTTTVVVLRSS